MALKEDENRNTVQMAVVFSKLLESRSSNKQFRNATRITFDVCPPTLEFSRFDGFLKLRKILIPKSVVHIGSCCFKGCISLEFHVTFANGSVLKYFGEGAFQDCQKLHDLEIPASVEYIGKECFSNCCFLSHISFANGSVLKYVGNDAFSGCVRLKEIPSIVKIIQI